MYGEDTSMDIMFHVVPILVGIGFVAIMVLFLYAIIQNVKRTKKNNASPVLSVIATVVDKRNHVSRSMGNDTMSSSYYSEYYVTFEVESGDRMELEVPEDQYGFLVKGDHGTLTFQGTVFLEFKR